MVNSLFNQNAKLKKVRFLIYRYFSLGGTDTPKFYSSLNINWFSLIQCSQHNITYLALLYKYFLNQLRRFTGSIIN